MKENSVIRFCSGGGKNFLFARKTKNEKKHFWGN